MCTRAIPPPVRQERRGSFFKVSAPLITLSVLKRGEWVGHLELILGNTEEEDGWAQQRL